MASSNRLLRRLQETIILRAGLRGGKVDKTLLRGLDPQPSAVFSMLVSTRACTDSEIIDFIKGLKDLKDPSTGELIITVHALEALANELWKVQVQDEMSPAVGASKPTHESKPTDGAPQGCNQGRNESAQEAGIGNDKQAAADANHAHRQGAPGNGISQSVPTAPNSDNPETGVQSNPGATITGYPGVTGGNATAKQGTAASAPADKTFEERTPAATLADVLPAQANSAATHVGGNPDASHAGANPAAGIFGRQPVITPAAGKPSVARGQSLKATALSGPGQKRPRESRDEHADPSAAVQAAQDANDQIPAEDTDASAKQPVASEPPKSKGARTTPPHPSWAPSTITAWVDRILDVVPPDGSPIDLSQIGILVPRPTNVPKNRTLHKILKGYTTWFSVDGLKVRRTQAAMHGASAQENAKPVPVIEFD